MKRQITKKQPYNKQHKIIRSALIWILPIVLVGSLFLTQNNSPITLVKQVFASDVSSNSEQTQSDQTQEDMALTNGVIPSDAVRLRIIANSDSPQDQQLKRDIRDQIIAVVGKKLQGVTDHIQAESVLKQSVSELDKVAQNVIHKEGFTYPTQTEVGVVPFPTKLYGDQVYPAGNYEALRICIGKAQGQNWWCVLFPPLCFVDLANGDAVPNKRDFPDTNPKHASTKTEASHSSNTSKVKSDQTATKSDTHMNQDTQGNPSGGIQVRFAVVDYGKKLVTVLVKAITGLFHTLFG